MNNEIIKQGAYYLLRGGTLLSEPCKKCGDLQIKYKDEIFCMNCRNTDQVKIQHNILKEEDKDIKGNGINDNMNEPMVKTILSSEIDTDKLLIQIETKLILDVLEISKRINPLNDLKDCSQNLKILSEYLKVIKKLKKISQL